MQYVGYIVTNQVLLPWDDLTKNGVANLSAGNGRIQIELVCPVGEMCQCSGWWTLINHMHYAEIIPHRSFKTCGWSLNAANTWLSHALDTEGIALIKTGGALMDWWIQSPGVLCFWHNSEAEKQWALKHAMVCWIHKSGSLSVEVIYIYIYCFSSQSLIISRLAKTNELSQKVKMPTLCSRLS